MEEVEITIKLTTEEHRVISKMLKGKLIQEGIKEFASILLKMEAENEKSN